MSPLYVYALLGEPPRGAPGVGLAGEALRVIDCAGLLAVAGELDALPPLDAAALRAHDAAVRRLAAGAVLPVRFGALVPDERTLAERLAQQAGRRREALALVEGCEQMTLRVYGEPALSRPPLAASGPAEAGGAGGFPPPEPAASDDAYGAGPGARYLAARLRARAAARSVPEIEPLRPVLAPLVRAERAERHAAGPLVASVYHLVPRGGGPAYAAALDASSHRLAAARVAVSGPWPPYAFAPADLHEGLGAGGRSPRGGEGA